jgi:acyl-CoA thioesterase FadM
MAKIYTWRFQVRFYELNRYQHVSPATFQNYLQELAIQASSANGYTPEWYTANHCIWVIRRMTARYYEPVTYGDEIEGRSWVSDFQRVRSHREYELVQVSDGQRVLRGRADWVFIDTQTKRPKRTLPEFEDAFQPDPSTLEDLTISFTNAEIYENPSIQRIERPIYAYEIDELGHVNNSQYLRWIEDASQGMLYPVMHDIEYHRETKPDDRVAITRWLAERHALYQKWIYEIRHAQTDDLIARDILIAKEL